MLDEVKIETESIQFSAILISNVDQGSPQSHTVLLDKLRQCGIHGALHTGIVVVWKVWSK